MSAHWRPFAMHPLLRNPLVDYARFAANWVANRRRQPKLHQHYMALALESTFEPNTTLFEGARLYRCHVGAHSYIGGGTDMARTRVGRFCSVGPGCRFGMGRHPTQLVTTSPMFYSTQRHTGAPFADRSYFDEHADIEIGHDVWIGANAILLDGVVIGNGAIIGAGAVVTRSVSPYAIVGGVPAAVIRRRFDDATIEALERSGWWDLDDNWLRAHVRLFHDPVRFLAEVAAHAPVARSKSA